MEPEEIERTLISSLKTPEHLNILRQKYRLSPRHFPYYTDEAQFIWDYIEKQGTAPDFNLIAATFPKFKYTPTDSFDYIAEVFRKDFVRRSIYTIIEGHEGTIKKDSESALVGVIHQLQTLMRHDDMSRVVIDSEAMNRFDDYKNRADGILNQRLWWGIEPFDNYPVMMLRGQMVGVMADTKVGKSWLGLKIALTNYLRGSKVVIISPELNRTFMEARVDTVLAYDSGYPISHEKLLYGIPGIEENYQKYLDTIDKSNLIFYLNTPSDKFTVSSVASIVKTDKPDLVLIDGIYLMQDEEHGTQSWDQVKNKCRGLKTLATEANVVLLVTNQTSRPRESNESNSVLPQANSVAYGYDFNRFVDILVSIGGSRATPDVREVAIPLIRSGPAVVGKYPISFDTDTGDIGRTVGEVPTMSMAGFNI